MKRAIWALFLLAAFPARAEVPLTLEGSLEQGALLRGRTSPSAKVVLDGHAVRVAPDGQFIFGFGRDAPAPAVLEVSVGGETLRRDLAVKARQYDIQRINGLPEQQVTPDPALLERIKRENAMVTKARTTDSDLLFFRDSLIWPARGPISGVYGSQRILNGEPRAPHYGVDVAAPTGTPVKVVLSGTVTLAESNLYLTGGTVLVDHGYGLSTTYMHMSRLDVKVGQKLSQGDQIGLVGATGRVTGPHLDWRVNWYQVRLDAAVVAGPMPKD